MRVMTIILILMVMRCVFNNKITLVFPTLPIVKNIIDNNKLEHGFSCFFSFSAHRAVPRSTKTALPAENK